MDKIPVKADLSTSVNEILKELALPASKQIGQALGNVFGLFNTATLPIKLGNEYAKRNFEKYSERLKDIPEENIKEVDPEIAIPIIEKMSYTRNEDLANAYANLLASASDKNKVDFVHPGFIEKINNMAPGEAKIIELLKNIDNLYYIIFQAKSSKNSHYQSLSVKLTGIETQINSDIEKTTIHLENLVSLSIVEDNEGTYKVDDKGYNALIERYSSLQNVYEKGIKNNVFKDMDQLEIKRSYFKVTTLGRIFIRACTPCTVLTVYPKKNGN